MVQMLGRVIKCIWIRMDVGQAMRDGEESEEVGGEAVDEFPKE